MGICWMSVCNSLSGDTEVLIQTITSWNIQKIQIRNVYRIVWAQVSDCSTGGFSNNLAKDKILSAGICP